MDFGELMEDLTKSFFTPPNPKVNERQTFKIIKSYNNQPLKISVPLSVTMLHTQEELANENNILDDAMTDWNPADAGYTPVETESGKVFYIDEYAADEVKSFIKDNKLKQ